MQYGEFHAARFHVQILNGKIRLWRQTVSGKPFAHLGQHGTHVGIIDTQHCQTIKGILLTNVRKLSFKRSIVW